MKFAEAARHLDARLNRFWDNHRGQRWTATDATAVREVLFRARQRVAPNDRSSRGSN